MDTLVSPGPDNSFLTNVYRKPTHTDQYLHWDSHHNVFGKYIILNTLTHRARTVCANQWLLFKEEEQIKGALQRFKYPICPLNRCKIKSSHRFDTTHTHSDTTTTTNNNNHMVVPYTKGLIERTSVVE